MLIHSAAFSPKMYEKNFWNVPSKPGIVGSSPIWGDWEQSGAAKVCLAHNPVPRFHRKCMKKTSEMCPSGLMDKALAF